MLWVLGDAVFVSSVTAAMLGAAATALLAGKMLGKYWQQAVTAASSYMLRVWQDTIGVNPVTAATLSAQI